MAYEKIKKAKRLFGDLKFKNTPEVLEAAPLIIKQTHQPTISMK